MRPSGPTPAGASTPTTAEDVVAETFVVCWRRFDDVPDDPLPWLFGVARRCLANRRRSDDRRSALAERAGAELDAAGRDVADAVGERDRMLTAFAALSENDREVLSLVAWEGLDVAGAAQAMGCSTAALKVRLHRARRRLRRHLEEDERSFRPTTAGELA